MRHVPHVSCDQTRAATGQVPFVGVSALLGLSGDATVTATNTAVSRCPCLQTVSLPIAEGEKVPYPNPNNPDPILTPTLTVTTRTLALTYPQP